MGPLCHRDPQDEEALICVASFPSISLLYVLLTAEHPDLDLRITFVPAVFHQSHRCTTSEVPQQERDVLYTSGAIITTVVIAMSTQPLLQTAPGSSQPPRNTALSRAPPSFLLTFFPRQAHRAPDPRRTQSLLRQRAHLPLMAQLHRYPRRPRHRSS